MTTYIGFDNEGNEIAESDTLYLCKRNSVVEIWSVDLSAEGLAAEPKKVWEKD